jgi:hypothetical protein
MTTNTRDRDRKIASIGEREMLANSNEDPIIVIATAVKKTRIQEEKEEASCLEFLRSKMRNADPKLKESFRNRFEGVEF